MSTHMANRQAENAEHTNISETKYTVTRRDGYAVWSFAALNGRERDTTKRATPEAQT